MPSAGAGGVRQGAGDRPADTLTVRREGEGEGDGRGREREREKQKEGGR